jgi:cytochrome b561
MAGKVTGYSRAQVALHWTVLVLVAFQFLAHDGIEEAWRAFRRGQPTPADAAVLTYMHIGGGTLVLLLALARIYLRMTRGAPAPPANEPKLLQLAAEAVHLLIYALLLLLPLSGAVAWFAGIEAAADAHEWLKNVLLAAIALHVAGALFQHFVRRSGVLMRMLSPQRD